jgi:hypothetical protein
MTTSVWLLLILSLVAANLPFVNQKLFAVIPLPALQNQKAFWLRLLEIVVLYFVVGGFAILLEQQRGNVYVQNWEFYAITFCMFLVMAYPGFVWRYLRRQK